MQATTGVGFLQDQSSGSWKQASGNACGQCHEMIPGGLDRRHPLCLAIFLLYDNIGSTLP